MKRIVLTIAALLATACSFDVAPYEQAPRTLWLQSGQVGYAEQAQWGLPLPADFVLDVRSVDDVHRICNGDWTGGCAGAGRLTIRGDLPPAMFSAFLLHEMGHLLGAEHIDDTEACVDGHVGEFVMCAYGSHTPVLHTEDFAQLPGAISL
jgi:hypothetical protein